MELLILGMYLLLGSVGCLILIFGLFKVLEVHGDRLFDRPKRMRLGSPKKKVHKSAESRDESETEVDLQEASNETPVVVSGFELASSMSNSRVMENPRLISTQQLGEIEESLITVGLEQVIVAADRIERPRNSLLDAVRKCFMNRVEYVFVISHDNAADEMRKYHEIFQALAEEAIKDSKRFMGSDLFKIYQLPYNLDDCPYVFYRIKEPEQAGMTTIALRGVDARRGISNNYTYVPPEFARSIANGITGGAPRQISGDSVPELSLTRDSFQEGPEVLNDVSALNHKFMN